MYPSEAGVQVEPPTGHSSTRRTSLMTEHQKQRPSEFVRSQQNSHYHGQNQARIISAKKLLDNYVVQRHRAITGKASVRTLGGGSEICCYLSHNM